MVFVYWDELPEVNLEKMLKELATQIGKAKVREHPMPGYSSKPRSPEQVLNDLVGDSGGKAVINRLKLFEFEIRPIKESWPPGG